MTHDAPPDLPPDIAALMAGERAASAVPDATRVAVLARVHATVNGVVAPVTSAASRAWMVKGLASIVVVAAAAGVVWNAMSHHDSNGQVPAARLARAERAQVVVVTSEPSVVAPPITPPSIALPSPAVPSVPVEAHVVAVTAPVRDLAASAHASPSATVTTDVDDLADERALLDGARHSIAAHDGTAALAVLDEHARRFPHGRLIEEREGMAIEALVLAGDRTAAQTRADRFRRRYPDSVFLPVIDAALRALP